MAIEAKLASSGLKTAQRYQARQAPGQPDSANLQHIKVGILLQLQYRKDLFSLQTQIGPL